MSEELRGLDAWIAGEGVCTYCGQRDCVCPAEEDEPEDDLPCVFCGCLIGDEVGYGDNWGEGPICENCVRPPDETDEAEA